jgi:GDP-fucose transporter C1
MAPPPSAGLSVVAALALRARQLHIASVVAAYFAVSIALVFVNKVLLDSPGANGGAAGTGTTAGPSPTAIPAPLFVTWFQCLVTVAICWACGEAGRRVTAQQLQQQQQQAASGASPASPASSVLEEGGASPTSASLSAAGGASAPPPAAAAAPLPPLEAFFTQFPVVEFRTDVARRLLPLSLVFVGMVTFNNLALKFVEVSFYNVARSLTIVFNVLLTFAVLGERTSLRVVACLAAVVAGFFLGARGEMRFSLLGTSFGVVSSVFVSLNSIAQKRYMGVVEDNIWRLSAYNNANACLLFPPLIVLSGELSTIWEFSAAFFSLRFWGNMLLGGVFGFLIGIVTTLQIKATSPLTHNISGTAKACVQTVLAFWIWQNPTSYENVAGIALVLAGSMAYGYVRNLEMVAEAGAKRASSAPAAAASAAAAEVEAGAGSSASVEEGETSKMLPAPAAHARA